jgi:hypothetical protein
LIKSVGSTSSVPIECDLLNDITLAQLTMAESRPQPVSHRLATANVNKTRGVLSCDGSVIDLGWNQEPDHDGKPWVEGMHNEDVWALVRRFNKVNTMLKTSHSVSHTNTSEAIFELKQANAVPFGGLDLVVAEESQCTPNKLRSEMERLYMGMVGERWES